MKKIKDVMTRDVETVNPSDSLRTAAEKMRELDVGPMPVVEGKKLLGIVTDRDIVVRGIALGHDPNNSKVREVMTDDVQTCPPDASLKDAAKMMKEHQIRRLLVKDGDDLVGIVALADLSQDAGDKLSGDTLERISEPAKPAR